MGKRAKEFLQQSINTLEMRAKERGLEYEDSMLSTIGMFNLLTKTHLTESDGYLLMLLLKLARNFSGFKEDDLVDLIAYSALFAEARSKNNG